MKAIWSKLVFTNKAQAPKEFKTSAGAKKVVVDDQNAMGYIEKSAVDDTVNVILTLQKARSSKPTTVSRPVWM